MAETFRERIFFVNCPDPGDTNSKIDPENQFGR